MKDETIYDDPPEDPKLAADTNPPLPSQTHGYSYQEDQKHPEPHRIGDQKNPRSEEKRQELLAKGENPKREAPVDPAAELKNAREQKK